MDEVDGMSAGDRGGVGALNALIKKSKVGFAMEFLMIIYLSFFSDSHNMYCQ